MAAKVNWNQIDIEHLSAEHRVTCFDEVNLGYSPEEAMLEAYRCIQCPRPACQDGCPNNNPIRDFLGLIAEGKFQEAAQLGWTQNALLSCTGRVCAWENQCQGACVLGKLGDPINIGALERFMGDYAMGIPANTGTTRTIPAKVAVIGAGPAGLTVAHFLGGKGYSITVFDRHIRPGGVMSYGIPEFVLPQHVIDQEVKRIKGLGVNFELGVTIGRDLTIDRLFDQGYEAIFIGVGANQPTRINIPGHDLNGVWTAKDFLMNTSLNQITREGAGIVMEHRIGATGSITGLKDRLSNTSRSMIGPRVAVIGAGNTAMDAARTAIRLGAKEVTVLYRRSEAESPSRAIEIGFALEEGVRFQYLVSPTRFIGDTHGNITEIELVKMKLEETDETSRPRPVPIPGTEYTMAVDTCIIAIGYEQEELIPKEGRLAVDSSGGLIIDETTGATNRPGVFAGGDCVTGSKTVVHAIAAGRRAAAAMDHYLQSKRAKSG